MVKIAVLTEETCQRVKAEKARTNLAMELAALYEQMEKAKADAMAEFQTSQPYFDACIVYYGDGFDDCLKQVGSIYPYLDLSKIVIDEIVLQTLGGDDATSNKTDNSVHTIEQEVKDDNVILIQSTPKGPDAPVALPIMDPWSGDGPAFMNPTLFYALPS